MLITYMNAVYGGLLIGLAAILMLLFLGKIAGISGIFWSSFYQTGKGKLINFSWHWSFIIGLVAGAWLVHHLYGLPIPAASQAGPLWAVAAGLLVGLGTRLGSGCTSGHGICGIARFSLRSVAATLTFMSTGILTVFLTRHLLAL